MVDRTGRFKVFIVGAFLYYRGMFHIVLFEPEIPPNTGNIIRLCSNSGCQLHLIHPLGFSLDEKRLRRAGLDYREFIQICEHDDLQAFARDISPPRIFALSTKAGKIYSEVSYRQGDAFLFGPETRGLPAEVLSDLGDGQCLRIPMQAQSRSLNLSNAVAIITYEAWRQQGFS